MSRKAGVQQVRTTAKLLTLEDRLIAAGMLTAEELGEKLRKGNRSVFGVVVDRGDG
ncbi:MAG: hypothetical protein ABIK28_07730 [Planctomycetota bacterium]